ncbi:unnamed protein product, partial [Candidula unifasciata]
MYRQVSHYSAYLLFDTAGRQMLDGLSVAACNPNVTISSQEVRTEKENSKTDKFFQVITNQEIKLVVADCMTCSCCQTHFADREEQLGHYKCDWHRYNLHRRLKGLPCISEDAFEETAGDVSSISGSDEDEEGDDTWKGIDKLGHETSLVSDTESEESFIFAERKFYKVFFKTKEGELISLFRCLLHHKKNPLYDPDSILAAVNKLPEKNKWIVLMVSAGHFVGSVFHGNAVIDHKTFHRYTVRAKRGTAQSSKDSQGGAPKSAGATLRRYNEAALVQDVQDLLTRWEEHVKVSDYIFIRVPVANRAMFFGGKNPALKKDDPRIRVIPFATRRPTFSEAKRVHQMLASVECYGKAAEVSDVIPLSPPRIFDSETGQLVLRKDNSLPKSARNKKQPVPLAETTVKDDHDEGIEISLVETFEEIDLTELKQFDSSIKKRHKKKRAGSAEKQSTSNDSDKKMARWRNSLFTACMCANVCLDSCLKEPSSLHALSYVCDTLKSGSSVQQTDDITSLIPESSASLTANVPAIRDSNVKESSTSQLSVSEYNTLESDNHIQQMVDSSSSVNESAVKITSDSSAVVSFLNTPLSDDGTTFLHVAAQEGHPDIVTSLLSSGADPAGKNKAGKTPYNLAEAEVRNAFRRYMAKFPDQYDYSKAQ